MAQWSLLKVEAFSSCRPAWFFIYFHRWFGSSRRACNLHDKMRNFGHNSDISSFRQCTSGAHGYHLSLTSSWQSMCRSFAAVTEFYLFSVSLCAVSRWSYGVHCLLAVYCWLCCCFSSTSAIAAVSVTPELVNVRHVSSAGWCSLSCSHGMCSLSSPWYQQYLQLNK